MTSSACTVCDGHGIVGDWSDGTEEVPCPSCRRCSECRKRFVPAGSETACEPCRWLASRTCERCGHEHPIGTVVRGPEECVMCTRLGPWSATQAVLGKRTATDVLSGSTLLSSVVQHASARMGVVDMARSYVEARRAS